MQKVDKTIPKGGEPDGFLEESEEEKGKSGADWLPAHPIYRKTEMDGSV